MVCAPLLFLVSGSTKKVPDQASENERVNQYEFLGAGVPTKKAGCRGNNGGQLAFHNIALVEHARSPIRWLNKS